MKYRCVTTSVEGFIQQLAVAYITHGYWFYVTGEIPDDKNPAAIDVKLVERYGIAISKWARCRRKKQGFANMQYLRHKRFFVLLATKGQHVFFERERESLRDVRRVPIRIEGYSIGCRKGRDGRWHASVRIDALSFAELIAQFADISLRKSNQALVDSTRELRYARYAPVTRQIISLIRRTNRIRRAGGLSEISDEDVHQRRKSISPFGEASSLPSPLNAAPIWT